MIVRAQAGDTVDLLCWRVLGTTGAVTEQVLGRNPGLADLGPTLPAGHPVDLPDTADLAAATRQTVKLWD